MVCEDVGKALQTLGISQDGGKFPVDKTALYKVNNTIKRKNENGESLFFPWAENTESSRFRHKTPAANRAGKSGKRKRDASLGISQRNRFCFILWGRLFRFFQRTKGSVLIFKTDVPPFLTNICMREGGKQISAKESRLETVDNPDLDGLRNSFFWEVIYLFFVLAKLSWT